MKTEADHSRRKGERGKFKQDITLRNRKREEEFVPGETDKGGSKTGENVVRKDGSKEGYKEKEGIEHAKAMSHIW